MREGDHPANWYVDPWTSRRLRYWNGQAWTPHFYVGVSAVPEEVPGTPATTDVTVGGSPTPEMTAGERETGSSTTTEEFGRDLAKNRPGELVRARAEELRRAAPLRTWLARLALVHTDERAFRVGARGEELVGRRLGRLGPEWRVIHSVQIGDHDADIDHVVIGPGGVFTLNTKHHPRGRVWVGQRAIMINGTRVPYLRNSRFEATRAANLLSAACGFPVEVRAAIVIITTRFDLRQQPDEVFVGRPQTVVKWLEKRPVVLAPDEVATIYDHARRDTTWRPAGARSPGRANSTAHPPRSQATP